MCICAHNSVSCTDKLYNCYQTQRGMSKADPWDGLLPTVCDTYLAEETNTYIRLDYQQENPQATKSVLDQAQLVVWMCTSSLLGLVYALPFPDWVSLRLESYNNILCYVLSHSVVGPILPLNIPVQPE
jgi:hypothetical protein